MFFNVNKIIYKYTNSTIELSYQEYIIFKYSLVIGKPSRLF